MVVGVILVEAYSHFGRHFDISAREVEEVAAEHGSRRLFYPNDYILGKYKSDGETIDWEDGKYGNAPPERKIGIIVHIIGTVYMLVGLNTVCDIYFCGALDEMVEKFNVKPDVAGATFMAAGGSAPELFTSLIGAVGTESDVGFGTIVGSAVFNVLAVIGCCGMAAKEPIKLTWWPLFRDCTYYIFGLGMLGIFAYGKVQDVPGKDEKVGGGKIELWESIILFLMYFLYIVIMYFNEGLEKFVQGLVDRVTGGSKVQPVEEGEAKNVEKDGLRAGAQMSDAAPGPPEHHIGTINAQQPKDPAPVLSKGDGADGDGEHHHGKGGHKEHHMPKGSEHHLRRVHHKAHVVHHHSHHHEHHHDHERKSHHDHSSHDTVASAQSAPAATTQTPVVQVQEKGATKEEKLEEGTKDDAEKDKDKDKEKDTGEEKDKGEEDAGSEESEDDIAALIEKPDNTKDLVMWALCLPIYAPLYFLIPRPTPSRCILTFGVALIWIAGFSYWLVYFVTRFGEAILGGGDAVTIVMGFTLLAAGTSIPDLVSSMAVAAAGEGDMAVSSSIGSNIFDILVGLPMPWILKIGIVEMGIKGNSNFGVPIKSPYIALYVFLLLVMVGLVIVTILANKWKLNKVLGFGMMILYIIFLAIVLPLELLKLKVYI